MFFCWLCTLVKALMHTLVESSFSSSCWKWSTGLLGAHIQPAESDWLAPTWRHVALFRSMLTPSSPAWIMLPKSHRVTQFTLLCWLTWLRKQLQETRFGPCFQCGISQIFTGLHRHLSIITSDLLSSATKCRLKFPPAKKYGVHALWSTSFHIPCLDHANP